MVDYKGLSDQKLFNLLKKDDRLAFAEIYNRYKGPLYIHAYNKLRDKEEVRDILQQLFSILWMKRLEIDLKTHLSAYLFAAVRNRVFKVIAHKNVTSNYIASIQKFVVQEECITDYKVRENEFRKMIDKEIALLPPRMREIFEMSRKDYLSHKEIADNLGLSEQTVSKQISNALKILRTKLGFFAYMAVLLKL